MRNWLGRRWNRRGSTENQGADIGAISIESQCRVGGCLRLRARSVVAPGVARVAAFLRGAGHHGAALLRRTGIGEHVLDRCGTTTLSCRVGGRGGNVLLLLVEYRARLIGVAVGSGAA
jgi:hypothetical protein